MTTMLSCRQITQLATDYLERRMPFGTRVKFRLHIAMCKHCREYLRQLQATIAAAGALRDQGPPMSDVAREELLRRFRRWKN